MLPIGKARKLRITSILVLIALLLLVLWQNSAPTTLSLLLFSAELPLMVWLTTFLFTGILIGVALMWSYRKRP